MKLLKQIFCLHSRLNSTEIGDYGLGGEYRIVYSSPWSLFGTRLNHYKCGKCGGKYWETPFDYEQAKISESFLKFLKELQ